jgi:Outer membrane protein beta-barrel family/Carboxypeptidase regulatory-like domain
MKCYNVGRPFERWDIFLYLYRGLIFDVGPGRKRASWPALAKQGRIGQPLHCPVMHKQFRFFGFIVLLLASSQAGRAQSSSGLIRGTVRDSATGADLENASVTVYRIDSGRAAKLLGTRRTNNHGFVFRGLLRGNYGLIAGYLGYLPDTVEATLKATDTTGLIVAIDLRRNGREMMQVVVTARIPPAIVRNDTIAFNAGAYPTRPNATVEDLLRKLPGIEIDRDGNVTMQGQKIDKIYLDGKEFFLNDPRLATQNLPAEIVDQIEAFDSQSERSKLTGIKEATKTKSINIKLKKNRRKGFFGKVYAGTGTGAGSDPNSPVGAYSAGGAATSLGRAWVFGEANVNNINNQFTGEENRNGPGGGGIQTVNNWQLNYRGHSDARPGLLGSRSRSEDDAYPFSYTLNGGSNGSHTVLDQTSSTQTALTDSSLLSNRSSHAVSKTQSTSGNLFMEYRIDSSTVLNLWSGLGQTTASSNETDSTAVSTLKPSHTYLENQGVTVNGSQTSTFNLNNNLNFRWRGHTPGRTIFVAIDESHTHQDQPQTTYSLVNNLDSLGNLLLPTLINQHIAQTALTNGYSGSVAYTEPLKPGHLLDLSYRVNHSISRSDRASTDFDSLTGHYDLPDSGTSNHFTAYNTIQRFGVGYNVTEGKLRYQLGLALQFSELDNRNRTVDSTLLIRQTNWYPRASLLYSPGHGRSLHVDYSANTTAPSIQQLQPVADPTNPFLIKLGNPGLLQQLTHNLNFNYNSLNTHTFENWQATIQGSYSEHAITTSTTVLSGGIQQVQYINVNGVWNSSGDLTYGFPLGDQRKGNSSLSLRGSYGRNVSGVNGALDVTATLGWGASWKLNLHPTNRLFIESQAAVSFTGNHYSLSPMQDASTWLQVYALDASYSFPWSVTLSSFYHLQVTGAQGSLPVQAVSLWNGAVYKDLGRKRNAQVRLSVFGILNTTHNVSQSTGANFVSTVQSNLPGRVLLLSFVWHFRKFPGAGSAK